MTYESYSIKETQDIAANLAKNARAGQVYALGGDLGAGKTAFTQGFGRGLGVIENICSPTFTILRTYEGGRLPLHHFDVYRIGDPEEMEEIGYEDCFYGEGISLVEWAELIEDLLPPDTIYIDIRRVPERGEDFRLISIDG